MPPEPLPTGRSVVVGPGQAPPPAWDGCERIAVAGIDAALAAELHAAWLGRRPTVIELHPGIGLDDPVRPPDERVEGRAPWEWTVDLDLTGERLHHAVWANSADGRRADRPAYRWAAEAIAAGARPVPDGRRPATAADVLLPDGRPAVCDGGPLDASLAERAGMAVVHRVGIEYRSLRPLDSLRPLADEAGREAGALAPDQEAAVREPRAGARVIAPAGSGKTRVLTERARLLMAGWGLPPAAVALVAYNVRAASEMRERLADRPELRIRTLNALGLRLCGRAKTIDEPEVRRILSELISFPRRAETDPAAPWLEALSRVRLGLVNPSDAEDEVGDVADLDRVARAYREELAARDAVDFDEQITASITRLLADPGFRARSQRAARVLLVDEFQDLTPAHLLLLRLLSGPAGSVFGVGDDDQTIYGYAGATPRWLVDFERWFPGSASHPLEVNYRCPAPVVTAAAYLLSRNSVRVAKEIRSAPSAADTGLEVIAADAKRGPARTTAERVKKLIDRGTPPGEIAVLSRVNASLVPVQVLLGHAGVPLAGAGDRRFLQRGGVRAALAWLELASAPAKARPAAAIREAARRPKRGMSNGLLDLLARPRGLDSLQSLPTWLESKGSSRDADKVDQFVRDVDLVRQAAAGGTAKVLRVVRGQIGGGGLDASAQALDQWSHGAIAAHADDLDALTELAALEPDPSRFGVWLADQLDRPADPDGVTLASIHSVKGREWPHVVLHHASAGLMPHRLSTDDEEERRIFHVGITRASNTVAIVAGEHPSPFIAEMASPGTPAVPDRPRATAARRATEPTAARRAAAAAAAGAGPEPDERVWERLRAWRTERAKAAKVPPYVVFDDKTLRLIAVALPVTERDLLALKGIGPGKFESYGSELIALAEELRTGPA